MALSACYSCTWPSVAALLALPRLGMMMAVCIATFLILSISTVALYRLCLHPLCHVPGPRLAALTNAWYAYQVRNGRMLRLATTLHHKYGPVVRVGPNELWFNNKEAFRAIYSQQAASRLVHLLPSLAKKLTPL